MTPRRTTPSRQAVRPHSRPTVRRPRAFTLIELLVVISILGILMAMAFPAIALMQRLTRGGAAENTVGVAVRTAAAYAAKPPRSTTNPTGGDALTSQGAAVLFTPSGEIRILETDLVARARSNGQPLQNLDRYGYRDVSNLDYIMLPRSAGVVGIVRDNTGTLQLIAPPFAVRFNQSGQLVTGYAHAHNDNSETYMVYYDSNGDGLYDNTNDTTPPEAGLRYNGYNPDDYDLRQTPDAAMDDAGLRVLLPFERIETVVGVLLFNYEDLRREGLTLKANSGNVYVIDTTVSPARTWLLALGDDSTHLKNTRAIFFGRSSGAMIKEFR